MKWLLFWAAYAAIGLYVAVRIGRFMAEDKYADMSDSLDAALVSTIAGLFGIIWPFVALGVLIQHLIKAGARK